MAEREFSGSLFHEINKPHSTVNLLIGSKKFTEGWNSWRVSTMGLMNVGETEGSQIIQLFGRGVRLKGYGMSLKRSGKTQLPEDVTRPKHIGVLETLNIFGIRADYMAQFRDFLEEEGLPTNDERDRVPAAGHQEPRHAEAQDHPAQEDDQRREHRVRRRLPQARADPDRSPSPTPAETGHGLSAEEPGVLNWYPKIQALKSGGVAGRRCGGRAQPDAPDGQARRLPRPGSPVLRAGALQGGARLVQPEPDAGGLRRPCSRIRAGIGC